MSMKKLPEKFNKTWLLKSLPERGWLQGESEYDSLYIVPSGLKHDSGFMKIAIIGITGGEAEIAAYPDDIIWNLSEVENNLSNEMAIRTDCLYPSGILHVWSNRYTFVVGEAFSSTEVKLKLKEKQ